MNFDFTDEQYMFRDSIKSLLEQRFAFSRVLELEKDGALDADLWDALNNLGVFALLVPEKFGGLGLTVVDTALMLEEFGRSLVPAPIVETLAATDLIVRYGSAAQQGQLLPKIAAGKLKIGLACFEAESGYDPEDTVTRAAEAAGCVRISGRKILVPHAAAADLLLVSLRYGAAGRLGLALLEPNREGISLRVNSTIDLLAQYYEVEFANVPLHQNDLLGGAASSEAVWRLFDMGGQAAAAQMTGIASKVLELSTEYAVQRVQFDKPIGSFQAIKHRCADMAVSIEASRSAAYYASWAIDQQTADCAKAVSIAKSFCGDTARFACNESIQIHGGIGFTWELGLHLYLRRAKLLEYSYGDAAYHRERVVARTLADLEA
jgi:alkylation response protein AidB-like acyl-CoA dehydrogenase